MGLLFKLLWSNIMDYSFNRNRTDKITRETIIDELCQIAKLFEYVKFSQRQFDKVAKIHSNTVKREFWSWNQAILFLKEHLLKEGIELQDSKKPYNQIYSENDLFIELQRIRDIYWQRPSRWEREQSNPQISYKTYIHRFGSRENACASFLKFKLGDFEIKKAIIANKKVWNKSQHTNKPKTTRDIPINIRYQVLKRDNFKCKYCWKSPALESGIHLHIDHIIPYSKWWSNNIDNLQVLCQKCNIWKSDDFLE